MIRIVFIFISALLVGCSSPKFYNQIEDLNIEYYDREEYDKVKVYSKIAFSTIRNEIRDSDHIILLYMPPEALNNVNPYSGIFYNVNKKEYYGFIGYDDDKMLYNKLDLNTTDKYYKFIVSNYLNRNLTKLKELGEMNKLENVFIKEFIIDINIKTGSHYYFTFNHIKSNTDIEKNVFIDNADW